LKFLKRRSIPIPGKEKICLIYPKFRKHACVLWGLRQLWGIVNKLLHETILES